MLENERLVPKTNYLQNSYKVYRNDIKKATGADNSQDDESNVVAGSGIGRLLKRADNIKQHTKVDGAR